MHETYNTWLKNPIKIFCKCGCSEEIIITLDYKYRDIPKYIRGHNRRIHIIPESYKKWLDDGKPKVICQCGCNKEIIIINNHKYCGIPKYIRGHCRRNISCSEESNIKRRKKMSREKSPNWKGGISFLPYCPRFNNQKKEEIRNEYNRKCYLCGKDEKDIMEDQKKRNKKQSRLSVHHIDEDKEQGCNDKPWKLVPLCFSCHNKQHNNKKVKILKGDFYSN